MIIPVRCFTCNKVIGHLWETYKRLLQNMPSAADALNELKLHRTCCRRMFLSHVDTIDEVLALSNTENNFNYITEKTASGTTKIRTYIAR